MLNFILRRIQKVIIPLKIFVLIVGLAILACLVIYTAPTLGNVVMSALTIFVVLSLLLSFFLNANRSLLAALTASFLLFLKAVDLLSPLNLGLFVVFLVLLGLYLWKK